MEDALRSMVLVVREFIGGGRPLGDTLTAITGLGRAALDSDMAGITLAASGRLQTVVFTDPLVAAIDQAQYEADHGPCVDATRDRSVHRMVGEEDRRRWPHFAAAAAQHGVHSVLSIPVFVGDTSIGALNFYDDEPGHFDEDMVSWAEAFAGQSAIVAAYYEKAELADNLQRGLESRAIIEQAKGVIMATAGCTADDAFSILREQSQIENRKLRDIAAEIAARQGRDHRA